MDFDRDPYVFTSILIGISVDLHAFNLVVAFTTGTLTLSDTLWRGLDHSGFATCTLTLVGLNRVEPPAS